MLMPETVTRKIHFFRAITELNAAGQHVPFVYEPILERLNGIPFTLPGRYMLDDAGYVFGSPQPGKSSRIIFGKSRRRGLPWQEEDGDFKALAIPATAGIAELTHVVFFADNLVGAEYNHFGPRAASLARYLRKQCPAECPEVTFAPLLALDALTQLDALETIKLATIRVTRPYIARVAEASESLSAAFQQAATIGDAQDFELTLRPQKFSRGHLSDTVRDVLRRFVTLNANEQVISGLKVEGELGSDDIVIDLLADKLVMAKQVLQVDDRSRAVNSDSAFEAIEEAYAEVKEAALVAPAVGYGV